MSLFIYRRVQHLGYQGMSLQQLVDSMIKEGKIREMIIGGEEHGVRY